MAATLACGRPAQLLVLDTVISHPPKILTPIPIPHLNPDNLPYGRHTCLQTAGSAAGSGHGHL
eukprot:325982-Chlamydomonas_euryale.AAC.3